MPSPALEVEAGLDLVASLDPRNIVAEVGIVIGAVEGPAIVESERRCSARYGVSGTLGLGSTEIDRGNEVLEVPIKHLIQSDQLPAGVFEIRKCGDGCKGIRVVGPVLLMDVIGTDGEFGDQI